MADNELALRISAKTDEFVKKIQDAQTKVRSLSQQMSEIDKQLKTESVDRVKKLSEKLELAKRASEMAAKEAELYAEKIKKMTDKHEDASKMTDKQKEQLLKLSEQMATAQQKANTYAAEVNKLSQELNEEASSSDKAEKETEDMSEAIDSVSKSAKDGSNGLNTFGESVLANLASSAIEKGISLAINLFKNLASAAWNAAKQVAAAVKNYATETVDLAADYADALGYSEQVFTDQAEAVQKWVRDNSVALRINKSDLQGYVNSMGSLYRSFGMTTEEAAKYSEGLIQLATDLRAATGDDTKQIIESLTSVMTGGYKSGYKYGIVINEAAIKAKALAMGLVDVAVDEYKVEKARINLEKATKKATEATWKYGEGSLEAQEAQLAAEAAAAAFEEALGGQTLALTQAQKEAAIYALEMEQTAHLQGQGAKESGNYKSQLDALGTTFDNLKISIGEKLLPVATEFITQINDFMQSDAGKAVMDALTESVGMLADKVMELLQDERMTEWISNLKDEIPKAAEKILEFAGEISDLIPKVLDLADAALTFFGIGNGAEAARARESFIRTKDEVQKFADQSGISLEEAVKAITAYADTTDKDLSDIYDNWADYEPDIAQWYQKLATDADGAATDFDTAMQKLPESTQETLDEVSNKIMTYTSSDELRAKVRGWADGIAEAAESAFEGLKTAYQNLNQWLSDNKPRIISEDEDWRDQLDWSWRANSEASGGSVRAGQLYRVNDDHGRRTEMFIPNVDGYILNGNDTQRVINNSTNNSRSYGDLNVYVNSYGTDAATIADEIGAAVNRKLRISGAW